MHPTSCYSVAILPTQQCTPLSAARARVSRQLLFGINTHVPKLYKKSDIAVLHALFRSHLRGAWVTHGDEELLDSSRGWTYRHWVGPKHSSCKRWVIDEARGIGAYSKKSLQSWMSHYIAWVKSTLPDTVKTS